jgi:hypothetical protein
METKWITMHWENAADLRKAKLHLEPKLFQKYPNCPASISSIIRSSLILPVAEPRRVSTARIVPRIIARTCPRLLACVFRKHGSANQYLNHVRRTTD